MSWKSIEMQVALPRTVDASKMQEQTIKQNDQFQQGLVQNQLKEELQKRKKVNGFEHASKINTNNEEQKNQHHNKQQRKNDSEQKDQSELEHPFLGKNIDLSR